MKIRPLAQLAICIAALSCCNPSNSDKDNHKSDYANAVVETIMTRRSIRKYEARPVNRDTMDIILKCGINAPSARNCQPWAIRMVDSKDVIDSITKIYEHYNPELTQQDGFVNMFRNAPTVVFIGTCKDHIRDLDCGLMTENIVISAWSMGIGSCVLGAPSRFIRDTPEAEAFRKRLDFPANYELLICIGLGYPTEKPDAKPRCDNKIKYIN